MSKRVSNKRGKSKRYARSRVHLGYHKLQQIAQLKHMQDQLSKQELTDRVEEAVKFVANKIKSFFPKRRTRFQRGR